MKSFRQSAMFSQDATTCNSTFIALESMVNIYGYSLIDWERISYSQLLAPFFVSFD
jgi:hypothetical protein